jgi:alkylglycerol monooxygenase
VQLCFHFFEIFIFQAFPYFAVLLALEHIILKLQGKRGIRINDGITSMANGIFMLIKE